MNYTEKYHLPQWKKEDRIMMEDFNQMCADMEAGLVSNALAAASAQAVANAAQSNSYSPTNKPYVTGRYYGLEKDLTIELGFRPSFLIICGIEASYPLQYSDQLGHFLITGGNAQNKAVTFTDTGFTLNRMNTELPKLLECRNYDYIAFR